MFIDTHCHIHDPEFPLDIDVVLENAKTNKVERMICIGTDSINSKKAVEFAKKHDNIFAVVGVHPHEAKSGLGDIKDLIEAERHKIVAIGEIGLDYHYDHSPRQTQIEMLQSQIEMAINHDLPIVFHVREAFEDFWPIFDNFSGQIRGVLHSFTDNDENLQKAMDRGLYIGVNGFCTFTKDDTQKQMYNSLPMDIILLETDAPYLTPRPFRGKINEPAYIRNIAEYLAQERNILFEQIGAITTENADELFGLK